MGIVRDLKGMKFNRLLVLERAEKPLDSKQLKAFWLCRCDCGNEKILEGAKLTNGNTKSCGCLRSETVRKVLSTHGLSDTRFYNIWFGIKKRCYNESYEEYHLYGGRGITVSESQLTFENFMDDMYQSYIEFEEVNGKDSATIDRIDYDSDYCKENCKWASQLEQARNRSSNIAITVEGIEYPTITALAEAYELDYPLVYNRQRAGKSGLDLVKSSRASGVKGISNSKGIAVEVNEISYNSLTALQKDYPHISVVTISRRYRKDKRGADLVS